jgi:hypothetical protein
MEKIMKRITSVTVPVAAMLVALSAGDARTQSNPWSVSFDLGTQVALTGDVHGGGSGTVLSLPTQVEARSYNRIAVQGGIEFKWQGDATDLDGLAGAGLESINDEIRRWSMPITGGVTVRF